jgi:Na+-transporting NADH:ubiquinone oxidoreductase subunit E
MTDYPGLFLRAALVENLALSYFLGMCMFLAVSRRVETALGMGLAVLVVQSLATPLNNLIYTLVLADGALAWAGYPEIDLSFLSLVSFIGVIAAGVQILEMTLDRFFPLLHHRLGIYLPLVTVNCAILGGSLFMRERNYDFTESVVYGVGSGFGWALAILLMAGIQEKLKYSDIPRGLQGTGMSFVVVGLISLGFMAFSGIKVG